MKEYSFKACEAIKRPDGLVMHSVKKYTFRDFVDAISARYPNRLCYAIVGKEDDHRFTYRYMAFKIHAVSQFLLNSGYRKGDKIAIFGESSPEWMIFYLGVTSIGCIAVPILPAFSANDTVNALKNCEAKAICGGKKQISLIKDFIIENGLDVIRLEDLFHIPEGIVKENGLDDVLSLPGIDITHTKFRLGELSSLPLEEDDIASIIYTSGTTGSSKGVVLTHMNLLRNADKSTTEYIRIGHFRFLSILPLSHVYEFTLEHMLAMMTGCEIYFLGRPPAVSFLLPALKEVRPHAMMTVPLLMEKIYKAAVAPQIKNGGKLEKLYRNPLTHKLVCRVIGGKIKSTLGGHMKFLGIGGAALDPEVEKFLYDAKFPYAFGYGLTETSPMLAACGAKKHRYGKVGWVFPDIDMKLLDKDENGVGEIAVKGPSVTQGYYNNDELNKESFTEDGYFKTGDLGCIDKHNWLQIKGRCKTMILGPAGENIYPEAIESVINNMPFVEESLVVSDEGGLLALIKIDIEQMAKGLKISVEEASAEAANYINELRGKVNKELSSVNRIDNVELQKEPFVRTATQKIKRFLYQKKDEKGKGKDEK